MKDQPRQTLCELVERYGDSLSQDPRRTEGLLRDFCGEYKREIFVLVSALREEVAENLLAAQPGVPYPVLRAQLTKRLRENLALTPQAAQWAVDSWALALGVISDVVPAGDALPEAGPGPEGGQPLQLTGHRGWVHAVAFHPYGRFLASAGQDGTVRLWGREGEQGGRTLLRGVAPVYGITFSPDGNILAWSTQNGRVRRWEFSSDREARPSLRSDSSVRSVAFHPDGHLLAAASSTAILLWDVTKRDPALSLRGHGGPVQGVAFSPDGRILASAGGDHTVRLWDVASRREVHRLEEHREPVWSVAFSPTGRYLASGGYDKTVQLWDITRRRTVGQLEEYPGGVNCVTFGPDGRILAAASLDVVVLWDMVRGQVRQRLTGHSHLVQSVAFSPDGQTLASGSWDGTIRLWRIKGE